jgi:hypothetical protein
MPPRRSETFFAVAKCASCGRIFDSGFAVTGLANVTIRHCMSSCPYCGGMGIVRDTEITALNGVLSIVQGHDDPLGYVQAVQKNLQEAISQTPSIRERSKSELERLLGELAPKDGEERKQMLQIIALILKVILAAIAAGKAAEAAKNIQIHDVINIWNNTQNNTITYPPATPPSHKHGRKDGHRQR